MVIETRGLCKQFGDVHAVRGLELSVEQGEVFGFLGPNGAGKTTTIRMLLDFLRPTAGEAVVLGGRGADPAIRARIGYLPADLNLPPAYRGADVFEWFGALRGGVDRGRVGELVERFGLDPSRPIGELSTGNRRKVGIVQAFMHAPELPILDEPSSGLDPLLQRELYHLVREVVDGGATVFLSSHVLPEVERAADRVGILRAGELVTVASVDDLRRQARQRIELYVAGPPDASAFDGVPNVISASVVDGVIEVVVEGAVGPALEAAVGRFAIERIVCEPGDLEDVFLELYRGDGGA